MRLCLYTTIFTSPILLPSAQEQIDKKTHFYQESNTLIQQLYTPQGSQPKAINTLPFIKNFNKITNLKFPISYVNASKEFASTGQAIISILSQNTQKYKNATTDQNKNLVIKDTADAIFDFLLKISKDKRPDDDDKEKVNIDLFTERARQFITNILNHLTIQNPSDHIKREIKHNVFNILCSFSLHIIIDPITENPEIGCIQNNENNEQENILNLCSQPETIEKIALGIFQHLQKKFEKYTFQTNEQQDVDKIIILKFLNKINQASKQSLDHNTDPILLFSEEKSFFDQAKKNLDIFR